MDIEGPQSPIRSIREFALHIATVTIGILIALSLEALIEDHRNRALVEHTRADFVAEFTLNRAAVAADLKRSETTKTELEGLISYGQAKLVGKTPSLPPLATTRAFTFAENTVWETAVGTTALIHLPFREARLIAEAHSKQAALNALQEKAEGEWFELAAYGDPRSLPADQLRPAMQKVVVGYAYLISVSDVERRLIPSYDAALRAMRGR